MRVRAVPQVDHDVCMRYILQGSLECVDHLDWQICDEPDCVQHGCLSA